MQKPRAGSTSYSMMAWKLSNGLEGSTSYCVMVCCVPGARGAHVLFYEEVKYAKAPEPEEFETLIWFYDSMRRVQEPGGFDVLFYDGVQCQVTGG